MPNTALELRSLAPGHPASVLMASNFENSSPRGQIVDSETKGVVSKPGAAVPAKPFKTEAVLDLEPRKARNSKPLRSRPAWGGVQVSWSDGIHGDRPGVLDAGGTPANRIMQILQLSHLTQRCIVC
jgi:hypothetical protein